MDANEASVGRPTDEPDSKIYLPAVALPPNFGRLERLASSLFSLHGVVRVPYRTEK